MDIKLDPAELEQVTKQAILDVLSPETKAKILEQAVAAILLPSRGAWDKRSPLEIAFETALMQSARDEAYRIVKEDSEMVAKMNGLLREAMQRVLQMDLEKLSQRMADAFVSSLKEG